MQQHSLLLAEHKIRRNQWLSINYTTQLTTIYIIYISIYVLTVCKSFIVGFICTPP